MRRVIIIRYGGFGDALQAASILPHLKQEGWEVTVDTGEMGFELLRSDPCIDALLLTPRGSVPPADLARYWAGRCNGFNRVINLCESVEVSVLTTPSSMHFFHDDETRRRLFGDICYVERIHQTAGVPGPFVPRYCPLDEELEAAAAQAGGSRALVLALAGSAEYKVWPDAPDFVAELLDTTDCRVFLAGGKNEAPLAADLTDFVRQALLPEAAARLVDMTGWPVRQALAMACVADCVVGPETGMLNAVAGFPNAKVVLLSHSSPANLTKHWTNTFSISPGVPCHPCHRLHQTTKFCPRGPSGVHAACAESISAADVLQWAGPAMRKEPCERS